VNVEDAVTGHALRSLRLLLEAYAATELPQWDLFAANVKMVRADPGQVIFTAGEVHPYVYFVQHGLLKAQMNLEGGRRAATVFFPEEGDVLASMTSLGMEGVRRAALRGLHPRSSTIQAAVEAETIHTVVALESSLLARVSFRVIDHLATQHLAWARLIAAISVMYSTTLQADVAWLRSTPEQRYRQLLKENPGLVTRVTQRDLANFLNITDVALSRIAKRVRNEPLKATVDEPHESAVIGAVSPIG
jgi:CRP/FNR family transcriptional regulator, anaerobic regulatory protein